MFQLTRRQRSRLAWKFRPSMDGFNVPLLEARAVPVPVFGVTTSTDTPLTAWAVTWGDGTPGADTQTGSVTATSDNSFTNYVDFPTNADPYETLTEEGLVNSTFGGPIAGATPTLQAFSVTAEHMHTDTVTSYAYDIGQGDVEAVGPTVATETFSAGPISMEITDHGGSLAGDQVNVTFTANVSGQDAGFFRTASLTLASTYLTVNINNPASPTGLTATDYLGNTTTDPSFSVSSDADSFTVVVHVTLPNVLSTPVAVAYDSLLTSGAGPSPDVFDFGTNTTTVAQPFFSWSLSYSVTVP